VTKTKPKRSLDDAALCRDGRNAERPQFCTVTRLGYVHPSDRTRPPRRSIAVHPHRHVHPGAGGQRDLTIDPGRLPARIALRGLPHATSVLLQLRSISFCRFLTVARSPSWAALKIRCRSRRTFPSCSRQSTAPQSGTSSGPFTMRCLTCPSVPADQATSLQRLTCPRQHPFRNPGTRPGIRPVIQDDRWRSDHEVLVSCRLSPAGIGFLGILFPPGNSALLTVGLPARLSRPDPVGVPVFRMREARPGWVPSLLRGGGVIPVTVTSATGACRFTAASPVAPPEHPIGGGLGLRSIRRFTRFTRPAFPLPAAPGWNEGPSASSLGFAPHSHP
jgi:hypothetical protein